MTYDGLALIFLKVDIIPFDVARFFVLAQRFSHTFSGLAYTT